jgi:hypothetical protein
MNTQLLGILLNVNLSEKSRKNLYVEDILVKNMNSYRWLEQFFYILHNDYAKMLRQFMPWNINKYLIHLISGSCFKKLSDDIENKI